MRKKIHYHIKNDGTIFECTSQDEKSCPYKNLPYFQHENNARYFTKSVLAIKDKNLRAISKRILFEDTFNPLIEFEETKAMVNHFNDKPDLDEFYLVLLNKIKFIKNSILAPEYDRRVAMLKHFYDPYEYRSFDEIPEKGLLSIHSYTRIAEELSKVYSNSPEQQKRLNDFIKFKNKIRSIFGKSPLQCKIVFKLLESRKREKSSQIPDYENINDQTPIDNFLTPYIQEIDENGTVIKEVVDIKLINTSSRVRPFKNGEQAHSFWTKMNIYAFGSTYEINTYKFLFEELQNHELYDVMNNPKREIVAKLKKYEELLDIVLERKIELDK